MTRLPKEPPLWQAGSDTKAGEISSSPPCSAMSVGTCSASLKRPLGRWHQFSSKVLHSGREEETGKGELIWEQFLRCRFKGGAGGLSHAVGAAPYLLKSTVEFMIFWFWFLCLGVSPGCCFLGAIHLRYLDRVPSLQPGAPQLEQTG